MKWYVWPILLFLLAPIEAYPDTPSRSLPTALLIFREDMFIHRAMVDGLKEGVKKGAKFHIEYKGIRPDALYQPEGEGLKVDLVIAIGDVALQYALLKVQYQQGIYVLISNTELRARAEAMGHWTGSMLWVPIGMQLSLLHKTFPEIKRVGTIVTRSNEHNLMEEMGDAFTRELPSLEIKTIDSPSEILRRAVDLFKDVDAFIFYPDPVVFNSATIVELLKLQQELKVPIVAPAEALLNLGAFVSVAYDLDAIVDELERHLRDDGQPLFRKECCIEVSINQKVGNMLNVPWTTDVTKRRGKTRQLGD